MHNKTYNFQSPIKLELILPHLNQFKDEIISEYTGVKYIELSIQLTHSNDSIKVDLCKSVKVNIKTKMKDFMYLLTRNVTVLQSHFKKEVFNEIRFSFKEISYSEYLKPGAQYRKRLLLQSLINTNNFDESKKK